MIPALNLKSTAFFLCDVQDKLIPTIIDASKIISVANLLLKVSNILNIPVVITEQYPKGLGKTSSDVNVNFSLLQSKESETAGQNVKLFEKTQFSMLTPEVLFHTKALGADSIVLFGMETHVCIYQTVKDLLNHNFKVFLPADGISSRFQNDHQSALDQMRLWQGATISTSESIIFELLKDSRHEKFKEISSLLKERK